MENAASFGDGLYTESEDPRITKVGKILRRTSLDEIPQIINIVKGDMSFIGPRPIPMQIYRKYSNDVTRRHDVLPGITGWAQVNGRNTLTWPEKIEKDHEYIDNMSFLLDVTIIFRTITYLLTRKDIYPMRQKSASERKE